MTLVIPPTRRPVPEVLRNIVGNLQDLVRSEVLLAKIELKEQATEAAKAAATFGTGLISGFYGFGLLLLAAVYGLTMIMAAWLAALLLGTILSIVAIGLMSSGKNKFKHINPGRSKTIHRLEENVQWSKHAMK
jgi:uncharacterized membrane protein YqjE